MKSIKFPGVAALTIVSLFAVNQAAFAQDNVPEAVRVPAGNKAVLETAAAGKITYECKEVADKAGEFAWVLTSPDAKLKAQNGKAAGKYYGPPPTWEAKDGSKVTGTQLAVAPNGDTNLQLQLLKADPATGKGAMTDVTYVQRLMTKGGIAPEAECTQAKKGSKEKVRYEANYIFWKAN